MSADATNDHPVVIGRWLRFLNPDHDGQVWVPIANITRIEAYDGMIDVLHVTPSMDAVDDAAHDATQAWDRIYCPNPAEVAETIARA